MCVQKCKNKDFYKFNTIERQWSLHRIEAAWVNLLSYEDMHRNKDI